MKKPSVTPGGDAAPSRAAAPDLRPLHDLSDAPVAEAALERWRDRCIRAIETGNGIPTVGHLWWKRPDEQVIRAICSALRLEDMRRAYGKDGEWLQLQLLDDQASALAIYAPRTARGYGLARAWLRDELAREVGLG